jgi:hypothetical protein
MQADEGFLKGLAVVDDIAYFGTSPPMQRQDRDGPNVDCDVVAVDLVTHQEVFRHKVATHGLLNIVSAPDLSESSSYIAQRAPWGPTLRPEVPMQKPLSLRKSIAEMTSFQVCQADLLGTQGHHNVFQKGRMDVSNLTCQVTGMQSTQADLTETTTGVSALNIRGDSTESSTANGGAKQSWSEAWLERPIDENAASSKWLTLMPRMDLKVKLQALDDGDFGKKASKSNLPVYLYLGKVIPELIQPAQVRPSSTTSSVLTLPVPSSVYSLTAMMNQYNCYLLLQKAVAIAGKTSFNA